MITAACRIYMNEQLQWTLQATCSDCATETTAPLHMGVPVHCTKCHAPIQIDPARTVFHRANGVGYWKGW